MLIGGGGGGCVGIARFTPVYASDNELTPDQGMRDGELSGYGGS